MIISTEQKVKDLADAIVSRTHEVYLYDINIQNYQTIISASDGEYPAHLMALKDLPQDQAIQQCPIEDLSELAELQQYARVSYLIRTEILERTKANSLLQVLIAQLKALIGEVNYDAAIEEAVARRNAA